MQDLILSLDTSPPVDLDKAQQKISHSNDLLGSMLYGKWTQWSDNRREIESNWLQDLRAYDQVNEPDVAQISKFHSHIYIGLSRTKANAAFARITDLISDDFWDILPTPVPESERKLEGIPNFIDEMKARAEAMKTEISDKLIDLDFDGHLKSAVLEACIIGTGVMKVTPGVKKIERWGFTSDTDTGISEWDVIKSETPYPVMGSPSVFDIFPDPYATREEDMSGVFERHVLNRRQFAELKDDSRFDVDKIDEILEQSANGNHVPLYHETERRSLAKNQDTTAAGGDRYDVIEYWGLVTGRMLKSAGVEGVEDDSETLWANCWVCAGKTLLAKISPLKKQKIPYSFFVYSRIPHQFFGVSPVRMIRHTQGMLNGSMRAMLDSMVLSAYPISEINVTMLQDGQDPSVITPGMTYLRDSGDPSVPAVRWFSPQAPTSQLLSIVGMLSQFADNESALPSYAYESQSNANTTSSGLSMQLGTAKLPIKAVVKNLENCVSKVIHAMYDFEMQFSDNDAIKGDLDISVMGTSAIVAKEQKSQALMQFLNIVSNPQDALSVDRKYLLKQVAEALEIDSKLAIPAVMPEQAAPPAPAPDPLNVARAELATVQAEKEKSAKSKIDAERTESIIRSLFASIQAGQIVATNPAITPIADSIYMSAGGADLNGAPLISPSEAPAQPMDIQENSHPNFPANPAAPQMPAGVPMNNVPAQLPSPEQGLNQGINTMRNEQ